MDFGFLFVIGGIGIAFSLLIGLLYYVVKYYKEDKKKLSFGSFLGSMCWAGILINMFNGDGPYFEIWLMISFILGIIGSSIVIIEYWKMNKAVGWKKKIGFIYLGVILAILFIFFGFRLITLLIK